MTLSHHVYQAIGAHVGVEMIDRAMSSGDFHTLMEITKTFDFETLLSNDIDTSYEQCTEAADSVLIHTGVENNLLIEHAQLITQFENEIDEYPEHVSCSCEYLYLRKSITKVKLTDKLGNSVWFRLKEYILGEYPNTDEVGTLYSAIIVSLPLKTINCPQGPRCKFGTNHPREVKISHSEYDKSRLLNKYSRFRKHAICFLFTLAERNVETLCRCVQFDENIK